MKRVLASYRYSCHGCKSRANYERLQYIHMPLGLVKEDARSCRITEESRQDYARAVARDRFLQALVAGEPITPEMQEACIHFYLDDLQDPLRWPHPVRELSSGRAFSPTGWGDLGEFDEVLASLGITAIQTSTMISTPLPIPIPAGPYDGALVGGTSPQTVKEALRQFQAVASISHLEEGHQEDFVEVKQWLERAAAGDLGMMCTLV